MPNSCKTIPLKSGFLLTIFVLCFFVAEISGAVLTVTSNTDSDDHNCNSHCSLREAIEVATPGGTIVFSPSLRGTTIQLERSLVIDKRLTIDAPNKRRITIKGNNAFRIFDLESNGEAIIVLIDGLIIRDGNALNSDGGGVYFNGNPGSVLFMSNCLITNNTARRGGGVYIIGSIFFISDSTIANNTATGDGGAGGINVFHSRMKIVNSTISGNASLSQTSGAGAIHSTPSDFVIINSTIAYNTSYGTDSNLSAGGVLSLSIAQFGLVGFVNSIVAKNTGVNPDLHGRFNGGSSSNLIGVGNPTTPFINGVNDNIVGTAHTPADPQLGILGDNGGNLPTHALSADSSAINAGRNSSAVGWFSEVLTRDQRNFERIAGSTVDMGAVESGALQLVVSATVTGRVTTPTGRSMSGTKITMRSQTGEVRTAITNPFGYYRFTNVPVDQTYIFESMHKRHSFISQTLLVEEVTEYLNFPTD